MKILLLYGVKGNSIKENIEILLKNFPPNFVIKKRELFIYFIKYHNIYLDLIKIKKINSTELKYFEENYETIIDFNDIKNNYNLVKNFLNNKEINDIKKYFK